MITTTTDKPVPIARVDHPVDVNKLIADLGDATVTTQGPSCSGTDGKRYLYTSSACGLAARYEERLSRRATAPGGPETRCIE